MNIQSFFVLFIIYSFLGWIIEVAFTWYKDKKIVNRGFLIGPYCPIYGIGGILIILLLKKYEQEPFVLFVMAILICSVLEYVTSYLLEKIFKARWWDYSDRKFNINGRICLETLIPFGILGCFVVYIVNPFFSNILIDFSNVLLNTVFLVFLIIFSIDLVISFSVISKIKMVVSSKKSDNTIEIKKRVKKYIEKNYKLVRRLTNSFPNLKSIIKFRNKK